MMMVLLSNAIRGKCVLRTIEYRGRQSRRVKNDCNRAWAVSHIDCLRFALHYSRFHRLGTSWPGWFFAGRRLPGFNARIDPIRKDRNSLQTV